jgi:hypothetical protein
MITTWISEHEGKQYSQVQDKDLNELFQEVRQTFNNTYLLQESCYDTRGFWARLFRKPKQIFTTYTLYAGSGIDYQVINFCQDHSWSNTSVTKSYIMTYFFGLINGKKL